MYQKINFAETKDLFSLYLDSSRKKKISYNKDSAKEFQRRFRQLSLLMEIIADISVSEKNSKHRVIPSEELWMYTEFFYYVAFRSRNILRTLPGLQKFDCPGIRDVRNHLIEHSDKKNVTLLSDSFSWGKSSGPIIKPRREVWEANIHPDRGLYENYVEFQENLNSLLRRAISKEM